VLRHFGLDLPSSDVLRVCRFDPKEGTHAIALAVGLAECGLVVEFSSDPDPAPTALEEQMLARAQSLGLAITPGRTLREIAEALERGAIAIPIFRLGQDALDAHFSPLVRIDGAVAILPNEDDTIEVTDLELRRQAPGLLRQCVIAFAPAAT
jgi:hypothetical protein